MVFKIMIGDNAEQRSDNPHNGNGVKVKSPPAILQPLVLQRQVFGAIRLYINDEREECGNKRSDYKEVAKIADGVVHGWALNGH